MTIKIKRTLTGVVLFKSEAPAGMDSSLHLRYALEKATQSGVDLSDANLSGANLSGADLSVANLRGADLSDADLSVANLRVANLSVANLSGANLSDADLSGANLSGVNLRDANLSGADLRGANLRGVDLRDAYLRGASFGEGVTAEQGVLQLIGLRWDVIIFDAHMRVGCQMHPLSDWASFDDRRISEMDGVHALRFWRQHKSALLTLAQRGNAPAAIANAEGGAA